VRVLQVTDWNPTPGGVETYVRDVCPALQAAGISVRVLTSSAGSAMDGAADLVAWGTSAPLAQAGLQLANPFAWARMREALRRFRPDVVHVHSFAYYLSPAVVAAARGVPVVITIHDYKPVCPLGTKLLPGGRHCADRAGAVCWRSGCLSLPRWVREQPRRRAIVAALARAKVRLAGSRWMQRVLAGDGLESEVVGYPVAPPAPGFSRCPTEHPSLLYCGRLAREKGVDLLLRAFAPIARALPRSRLLLAGDGPERAHLERLVADLGTSEAVRFAGWQPRSELDRLMAEAWALVAPSLWAEPFGLVAPEAIVRGLPVVASAAGGLAETVAEGLSGLTFPAGDGEALGRCLDAIVRRAAFPGHAVEPAAVAATTAAHAPDRHAARLRAIYRRAAA
jgi:glycosyltransferase involved in cell wall biosynthesis